MFKKPKMEGGMGEGGWLGGRWGVTLCFISIVFFGCAGQIRRGVGDFLEISRSGLGCDNNPGGVCCQGWQYGGDN